jgi:hypothetical protein
LKAKSHGTALIRLHISHPSRKSDFIMVRLFVSILEYVLCLKHCGFIRACHLIGLFIVISHYFYLIFSDSLTGAHSGVEQKE